MDGSRPHINWQLPKDDALPPGMEATRAAIAQLLKRQREAGGAALKVRDMKASRAEAVREDEQATLKALRDGKTPPGPRLADATDARIAQLERQQAAYAELVREAEAALTVAARDHAAENEAAMAAMEAEARATIAAAVEQIAAVFERLEVAVGLRGFLEAASHPTRTGAGMYVRYWKPTLKVHAIRRANGDPYSLDSVLDALRRLGEPDEEPAPGPGRQWRDPDSGDGVYV
jgi:hypothetical protein